MIFIACDLGGTNIKIGVLKDGEVIKKSSLRAFSEKGIIHQLSNLEDEVKKLVRDSGYELQDCSGIGIAIPGLVNCKEKRVLSINEKYKDAVNFKFDEWAENKFGQPLVMDNDANLALLGEMNFGCAVGHENAVLMTLGTGIGTAAVINGRLLRGKHYQAGCLGGHFITKVNGRKCTCGSVGCVEAQVGSWAIPFEVKECKEFSESMLAKVDLIDVKNIICCMEKGDRLAQEIFNHLIDHWSAAVVNLIHAYDPEVVVLSGGIMKAGDKILKPLRKKVLEMAWTPWGEVEFLKAQDPETSVLLGLEYLLKEQDL
jgi:glucokinase